ncbi:stearoyl-CoA 9-desaturase, partial [Mycobacterium sp. ITM-2017-0098]
RDDAPETRSERMFDGLDASERRGLKSAIAAVRARRREKRAQKVLDTIVKREDLAA